MTGAAPESRRCPLPCCVGPPWPVKRGHLHDGVQDAGRFFAIAQQTDDASVSDSRRSTICDALSTSWFRTSTARFWHVKRGHFVTSYLNLRAPYLLCDNPVPPHHEGSDCR